MGRTSVANYLPDFERLGREQAYAERSGYRMARHTYAEVAATAFRFARELTARQVHKGDRVMLWGPNSAAWVAAFLGCANRGVIAVPMDHAASPDFALRVFRSDTGGDWLCEPPTIGSHQSFSRQLHRQPAANRWGGAAVGLGPPCQL